MRGIRHGASAIARRALALACGALVVLAARAEARTRLVDVRVGVHEGYARVVFETDEPARYELTKLGDADWVVYLGALGTPRTIPARDGAPSVEVAPVANGATAVRIRSATPVRVESQVLAAPPRLVLDLRPTAAEPSAAASPPPATAPAPEPETPAEPAPASEPPPAPTAPVEAAPETRQVEPPPAPVEPSAEATPPAEPAPPGGQEETAKPAAPPAPERSEETPPASAVSGAEPVPEPPPVGSAPPPTIALDPRSLAIGVAGGVALALLAVAARRRQTPAAPPAVDTARAAAQPAPPPAELAAPPPIQPDAIAEPAAPPPVPVPPEGLHDLVRMHERLDARLAATASELDAMRTRQARLEAQGHAHDAELTAQRAAIARLKLALRPAGVVRSTDRARNTTY